MPKLWLEILCHWNWHRLIIHHVIQYERTVTSDGEELNRTETITCACGHTVTHVDKRVHRSVITLPSLAQK